MAETIERIVWLDSSSHDAWHNPDIQEVRLLRCTTYGFVVYENEELVSLGQSTADSDDPQVAAVMTIPKVAIVERKVIWEGE